MDVERRHTRTHFEQSERRVPKTFETREGVLSETTVQASQIGETGSVVQERVSIRAREVRVLEEPIFKLAV